jgi:hypothetical protein
VIQISRRFTDSDFGGDPNLDQKIDIFEDRVMGWQIDIAEELHRLIDDPSNHGTTIQHAGFAILLVLFSYFEMITQYKRGTDSHGRSTDFITKGLEDVFPRKFNRNERRDIAELVRNGLYHSTFTKKGVLLDGKYPESLAIQGGVVLVNPHKMVDDIKSHFENYIADLRSRKDATEVSNFEDMYKHAMS